MHSVDKENVRLFEFMSFDGIYADTDTVKLKKNRNVHTMWNECLCGKLMFGQGRLFSFIVTLT